MEEDKPTKGPTSGTTTTPLRPLELPPFQLHSLLDPIFTPTPSSASPSATSSPSKPSTNPPSSPPSNSLGRFGQLVSGVTSSGTAGAATSGDITKLPNVRSVEASGERAWVGASDGRVRIYEVAASLGDEDNALQRSMSPDLVTSPSPGRIGSPSPRRRQATPVLEWIDEVHPTQSRKAADRISMLSHLNKAIIISEGLLTFHSLPNLTPLSVHQFPAIKGVQTFSLDESELGEREDGKNRDVMHICAIKRRTVLLIRVTNEGSATIKELPLRGGALLSTFRRGHVCIADAENYSIINLHEAVALPLLPISQSPNADMPITDPPTIDPRHRPAVACVGTNEFLIASHTGSTTLGVFLTEGGDPCRGTLEWGSNLRSLAVDAPYVIALLHNNTIEIHSLHTQEIVQVIPLPVSDITPPPPYSLQPRSLVRSWQGLEIGSATGANKVIPISVPLLPPSSASASSFISSPPRTPTRSRRAPSGTSSVSVGSGGVEEKGRGNPAKILLVGKNSLHAIAPLTLVAQADALLEKGRLEDALGLAAGVESSGSGVDSKKNPELAYVYLRAAYITLGETLFQDSFNHFLKSGCDPRLVVRMFPDLRDPLLSREEQITVCRGVRSEVNLGKTIDDYIMANLNRNYSPHLKPDVETASPTVELRAMLATTARDSLRGYLTKWREARRSSGEEVGSEVDSRKVDMVVDTTLVKLLAEEGRADALLQILDGPNDCVLQLVEPALLDAGLYDLLASIQVKRGETTKALDIWQKLIDGEYKDERYTGGLRQIFDKLWESENATVVEKYGVWLVKHDRTLGLTLFTDPKQKISFDTRDLFNKLSKVDSVAADLFLETVILQKRDTDARLHADLVKRYIDRLAELLADEETKSHLRDQETRYASLASLTPSSPPSFLFFLSSQYTEESTHSEFDRVRLKTILFLGTSSNYDVAGTKKELDAMELKGLRGLTLERAIVYGKLRLDRQALSLLLHSLQDLSSSETYCHQSGDPLLASDIASAASQLSIVMPKAKKVAASKREGDKERKVALGRLLVEICLSGRAEKGGEAESDGRREQITRVLETQALYLDTLEVLPQISAEWPLQQLSPFLSRSLRRSLHTRQEAALLKSLALSQNLSISERLGDLQMKMGPTVQTEGNVPVAVEDDKPVLVKLAEVEKEVKGYDVDDVVDLR